MQTIVEQFISKSDLMQIYFRETVELHAGNFDLNNLEQVVQLHFKELVEMIDEYDPYTGHHLYSASEIANFLGKQLDLKLFDLAGLTIGAKMHDIGKVGIPRSILQKPGKLSASERRIIDTHVDLGYCILSHFKTPWNLQQYALMHHERLDGSGYPHGVKGVDIPTTVRILSIADVVESLTAERPYRHRATLNEVIDYLHSEEGKYDVTIVKLLEGLVKV